jgi:hypothetical protein
VLQTFSPDQAVAAPAPPANTNAQPAPGGKLTVGPLNRKLAVSELAGEWSEDGHVMTGYVSSSTGAYAGYSAIATAEKMSIDGKGNMASKFTGTSASNTGAYQINEKSNAVITIDDDVLTITKQKGQGATSHWFVRGWEQRPDITVLKLNGPYYDKGVENIDRLRRDPSYASNLDKFWVRTTKK